MIPFQAPNVVAEDSQGFDVKPQDSFGFKVKESVDKDKNEMTQVFIYKDFFFFFFFAYL